MHQGLKPFRVETLGSIYESPTPLVGVMPKLCVDKALFCGAINGGREGEGGLQRIRHG